MQNYIVLKNANIKVDCHLPRKTSHIVFGKEAIIPSKLQIVKYLDTEGFYLIYLSSDDKEITDTFHDSINGAMEQAEWEYGVKKNDWW